MGNFDQMMTLLTKNAAASRWQRALQQAQALKRDLLATSDVDPEQLGWARFYQFKALYELKKYEAAYDLLEADEPAAYAMPPANVAWMFSVASELAMHLNQPDDIVAWADQAISLTRQLTGADGDARILRLLINTCNLLSQAGRPDLNTTFAVALIEHGRTLQTPELITTGYSYLLDNIASSDDEHCIEYALAHYRELKTLHGSTVDSDDIHELINEIEGAYWFHSVSGELAHENSGADIQLWNAAAHGHVEAVRTALASGAQINFIHHGAGGIPTALIAAAFYGHTPVVAELLRGGAQLEIENDNGRTALLLAADQGHAEIVGLLLEQGAAINHQDMFGQTALHIAGWQDHRAAVQKLLDGGADVEILDRTGTTPLALAATEDVPEIVAALLAAGAQLESTSPALQTPLMRAAMEGQGRVVQVLLEHGASREARDSHGATALDWARQEGHTGVMALLQV